MLSTIYKEKEKVWHGNDIPSLYNPKISLAQGLLHSMTIFGPKIAQISDDSGVQLTYNEIKVKTIRAAQNLQALGFKRKQVFALAARNSHNVAPIAFASYALGCPLNALDPSFGKTEYVHMFKITKPVLVFCDIECYQPINECLTKLGLSAKIYTFGGTIGRSESIDQLFKETHKENQFKPVEVDGPNETAMIVCTSGTTGLPKGVCLSHTTLLDNYSRGSEMSTSRDVMFCFSPLYWATGFGILLRGTLVGATRLITTEVYSPERMLRLIEKHKVTYSLHATHHIVLLLKKDQFKKTDLSSIKYLLVGGSKVPNHVRSEMSAQIPNGSFIVGYGASEAGGTISYDYPTVNKEHTLGRLADGLFIKIIDDNGSRCGVNVDGEICIKMKYKFLGYYDNQKATDETIDCEGFIRIGDIGHFDEDGDLCFTGRKKELLKYHNFQISPSELDAFLTESPDIKLACVVGMPDDVAPDLPAAVIVRAQGSKISEQDVYDMVANRFADHYKLRGGVYFVDSLPTTSSGKVLRRQVKETAIASYNARKT